MPSVGASGISPPWVQLVEKDEPILQGALTGKATHLLTGDKKHFRELLGTHVEGILVLQPGDYLAQRLGFCEMMNDER